MGIVSPTILLKCPVYMRCVMLREMLLYNYNKVFVSPY